MRLEQVSKVESMKRGLGELNIGRLLEGSFGRMGMLKNGSSGEDSFVRAGRPFEKPVGIRECSQDDLLVVRSSYVHVSLNLNGNFQPLFCRRIMVHAIEGALELVIDRRDHCCHW